MTQTSQLLDFIILLESKPELSLVDSRLYHQHSSRLAPQSFLGSKEFCLYMEDFERWLEEAEAIVQNDKM